MKIPPMLMEHERKVSWHGTVWCRSDKGILKRLIGYKGANPGNPGTKNLRIVTSTTNSHRLYAAVSHKTLLRLLETNKGILEILETDRPRKVYFDIDHLDPSVGLDRIKDEILKSFPAAEFAISGNPASGSYHIALLNYHYKHNADMQELKGWCNEQGRRELGFDPAPYGCNQQLKCINQSKPDKPCQVWIEGPKDVESHIVGHVQAESQDARELQLCLKIREPYNAKSIDVACIPQRDLPVPKNIIDIRTATPLETLQCLQNPVRGPLSIRHAHTLMAMCYAKVNNIPFTEFWAWARQKDPCPSRLQRYLERWEDPPKWYIRTPHIVTLLERSYPGIKRPKWTQVHQEALIYTPDIVLPTRYMSAADIPEARYVALGQGMGANKTGSVVQYLQEGQHKCIWITPRITLAKNTLGRFHPDYGMESYQVPKHLKRTLKDKDRLIIGAQSLRHLETMATADIQERVIIIDEVELVLLDWMSKTHDTWRETSWKVFMNLLTNCKKCIVMDAFLSSTTLRFMRALPGLPGQFVTVNRADRSSDVTITEIRPKTKEDPIGALIMHIAEALKDGKKVFCFYPYLGTSSTHVSIYAVRDTILEYAGLGPEHALCYTSLTSDKDINELATVNSNWCDKRLVITNSKITVGVNYDMEDYDLCYIAKAAFNSPRDITQVSARIRHLKSRQIYLMYLRGANKTDREEPILSCPIFEALKECCEVELRTKCSREICNTFFQLAGYKIDHTLAIKDINKDVFKYVTDSDLLFRWDYIPEVASLEDLEGLQNRCYTSSATQEDKLTLHKYNFISLFDSPHPDVLRHIWDSKCLPIVYGHLRFLREHGNIVRVAYNDLGITKLLELWPRTNRLSASTKARIFTEYKFTISQDSSDLLIMSRLLGVFYEHNVLEYESKAWVLSQDFLEVTEFVEDNISGVLTGLGALS